MNLRSTKICMVLFIGILISYPVHGAGTKLWNFSDIETWLRGEFQGTGLTSRGNIIPTMHADGTDLPARLAWDSVSVPDGQLVATSLPAGVHLISDHGESERLLTLDQLGITAMEKIKGQIYAAASPSGIIYEYNPEEQSFSKAGSVPDRYVWDMHVGPDGNGLYLATGPNATLYYLLAGGGITEVGSTGAKNLMDLTTHNGSLYVGDDRGGLYRLETNDNHNQPTRYSLNSIYGFNRGEVAALTSDQDHLYMAVNIRESGKSGQKQSSQTSALAEQLRQQSMDQSSRRVTSPEGPNTESPEPFQAKSSEQTMLETIRQSTRKRPSKLFDGLSGTLVYRMKPPKSMNIVYNDPNEIVHDLEAENNNLYVATGGQGRLYKILPDFTRVAYFQTDHKLVLSVDLEHGEPSVLTTGEGAGLFIRQPFDEEKTYYRSIPMDAQLLSRWGTFKSVGSDNLRHRTRSGNTSRPDTGWQPWSRYRDKKQFSINSAPGRYLQFETVFRSQTNKLSDVKIAYRIPNQQPQISSFEISSNPHELTPTNPPGNNAKKKQSPRGQSTPSPNGSGRSDNIRQLGWQVMDPDGDQLNYSLYYRLVNSTRWIKLADKHDINGQSYQWDLSNVSDGHYQLKLTVSDRVDNPPGNGYDASQQLGPVLIDNTPPTIKRIRRGNNQIQFTALDETSWILGARFRVSGGEWQSIHSEDSIFDESKETFTFEIPSSVDENDVIELRIKDEGGNETLSRVNRP